MNIYTANYQSPIGGLEIRASEFGILTIKFKDTLSQVAFQNTNIHLKNALEQLDGYFKRTLIMFSVKLHLQGTEFQKSVWNELIKIPFNCTITYKDIADSINKSKSVRAVGGANARNPISIIIPCHRVIGANKKLTGYAGGIWRKEWLLNFEAGLGL